MSVRFKFHAVVYLLVAFAVAQVALLLGRASGLLSISWTLAFSPSIVMGVFTLLVVLLCVGIALYVEFLTRWPSDLRTPTLLPTQTAADNG